jgi:molecular chaperone DnaK (HSP70)
LRLGKLSDGKSIGQIVNFSTHQVINKKKNSKFKEMEVSWEEYGRSTVQLPDSYDPEWKRNGREKEKEGKGKENELSLRSSSSPSPEIQITEKPKNGKKLPEIEFDVLTGSWNKITDEDRARWRTAFPAVDIEVELAKASSWLVANPANAKSRYRRFLTSWLSRAQDRAPRTTPAKPDGHGDAWSGVKRL